VILTARIVNFNFDIFFKTPVMYKNAHCDQAAQRAFEAFASYGLRPTHIAVRRGDEVFNFDISFPLLNGNATFKLTSEGGEIRIQNAASETDLEIVVDCVAKFYEHVPLPEINFTAISVSAQTTAPSIEAARTYLEQYANAAKGVSSAGVIAYGANVLGWPDEIRLAVDRSIMFPDGLFLVWTTRFGSSKITREVLKLADSAFRQFAENLDLEFANSQ
jgi:hypothetical protein